MFNFLKDKLKSALGKFTKKVSEEVEEEIVEVKKPAVEEKSSFKEKKVSKEMSAEKKEPIVREKIKKKIEEKIESAEKIKKTIDEKIDEVREEKINEEIDEKRLDRIDEKIKEEIDEEIETEFEEEIVEKIEEEQEVKKGFFSRIKDRFTGKEDENKKNKNVAVELEKKLETESELEPKAERELKKEPVVEEQKGFFGKLKEAVTHKTLSDEKFEEMFFDLEMALMEANVALEVIEKIKHDLKKNLVDTKIARIGVQGVVAETLRESIEELFNVEKIDLIEAIYKKKKEKNEPYVISFVGINGAGKTTTLAKIAYLLQKNGFSVVFAAADTFRAASMEQLQYHADKIGVKMIKHEYGSDPAAVAFDAVAHAKAKGKDVVLIDTAGRTNMDTNLMEELRKIIKVAKPDLNIFIGDAVTGNDAVEQAMKFNEYVGIDGIVLAKADVDEKGGCSVSISYVTKKPILYIGVGQTYDDLKEFDSSIVLKNLGFV